jgi:bifunctional DNA-binding transcriptional regulator/antitoxin component of YhaV-PrlF toxin-antitoxin module
MTQGYQFRALIEDAGEGGAYVSVPFDVEGAFGKKRVKVVATIDGVAYRGSLVRMGGACHLLPVPKEIRTKIGKNIGDEVEVEVVEDVEPRLVQVPDDLQKALAEDTGARSFFTGLSYTHQKEYVQWIEAAKKDETRQMRIQRALEWLNQGKRGV